MSEANVVNALASLGFIPYYSMLKKTRVALAWVCWLSITVLFLDLTGVTRLWLGCMAKIQFLPALMAMNIGVVVLWVVVTLLFGRIYCSVICPLGVLQDMFAHIGDMVHRRASKSKLGRYSYLGTKWSKVMRYGIFALFLISVVTGFSIFVQWLAPYSSYGRIVTALGRPIVWWINEGLAEWSAAQDNYVFYHVTWNGVNLSLAITAFVTAAILVTTAILGGRFYCNEICPVGTFLGLLSKRSLFRVHIDSSKCVHCGLCERKCKGLAINAKSAHIDNSRCIDCFNCLDVCHKGALKYGLPSKQGDEQVAAKNKAENAANEANPSETKPSTSVQEHSSENMGETSRRTFLAMAATVVAASGAKAADKIVDGGLAVVTDKKRVRRQTRISPPGAISLANMQQRCTGCQLCVSACPNGVLQPSTDLLHYMQPTLTYENAHCRPECHACSDVCPAGAIKPLGTTHEEKMANKSSLKIGRAVWVKENCLPLTDGVSCGNCSRHCPTSAIKMVLSDPSDRKSLRVPAIDEERCIGCGACEHLCPSRPFSAIYVEGIEVQRTI